MNSLKFFWKLSCFMMLSAFSIQTYAAQCSAIFPGPHTLASVGASALGNPVTCDGGSCLPIPTLTPATIPPISPTGAFNSTSISDGVYQHSSWGLNVGQTITFTGTGTAVIYFSGSVNIKQGTKLNVAGKPENVLIVAAGSINIEQGVQINGHIYSGGSTFVAANSIIKGSISAAGALTTGNFVTFEYDESSVNELDGHGFCDTPALELHLNFDEGSGQLIADDSGNGRDAVLGSSTSVESNDPSFVCEANGYFMNFERSANQHVVVPAFTPPAIGVVSFWLKVPSLPSSRQRVFGFGDGFEIRWEANDIMFLDINKSGSNSAMRTRSAIRASNVVRKWMHVAVVTNSTTNNWAIYLDGVLDNSGTNPQSQQPNNRLTIGGSTWRSTSEHLNGTIDDFRIYSGELRASDIAELASTPPEEIDCVELIANFQMDELAWSGSNGEVEDQVGNFDSVAINGVTTGGTSPAIPGNPGTCRYGSFDGANDYVQLPNSFENLQDSFTITAWINPSNLNSGSRIFIDDENNSQTGYGFSLGDPGTGRLRFYSRGVSPISVDTNNVISANTWTFVTAVHNSLNKTRQIYVNGVAQSLNGGGSAHSYTGNWGTDTGPATIGGETDRGEVNNRFTGDMDEVRVYKGALTSAQINAIYRETHPCSVTPQLYEVIHDGNGLTCESEPVTVQACVDASCSAVDTSISENISLLVNGAAQTVSIVNGIGTTSFNYRDTVTPATLGLSADYTCTNLLSGNTGQTGDACLVPFSSTGFSFSTIDNQVAGENFSASLSAVVDNNGVCTALVSDTTTIEMAMEYVAPRSAPSNGNEYTLNTALVRGNTSPPANSADYSNITLNFDGSGNAPLNNNIYEDAGQIRLHAKYVVPASGTEPAVTVIGNSNLFWVSPKFIGMSAFNATNTKLNATTAFVAPTHTAGDKFTFELTALNASGVVTTNYQPVDIEITLNRTGPNLAISSDGTFNFSGSGSQNVPLGGETESANFSAFDNGVSTYEDATYSEVGVFTVDVREMNYGNVGITVDGVEVVTANLSSVENVLYVGRFIPSYFVQTIAQDGSNNDISGTLTGATCGNWAYSGQEEISGDGSIIYQQRPQLEIEAYNSQDQKLLAYIGDFMKLEDDSIELSLSTDDAQNGEQGTLLQLSGDVSNDGDISQGTDGSLLYELSTLHHFTYEHTENSARAPFKPEMTIYVELIKDTDGVETKRALSAGNFTDVKPLAYNDGITEFNIRFGRLMIENSYGPETSTLEQHFITEYLINPLTNTFATNIDDNCTVIADKEGTTPLLALSDIGGGLVPSNVSIKTETGTLALGEFKGLDLGSTAQGQIGVEYTAPTWLLFDWDDDGTHDNNPEAVATFGQFRGNDRIIYWRESNQ